MDIHIFQDPIGHYTNSTCQRIYNLKSEDKKILFINISENHNAKESGLIIHLPENWNKIKNYFEKLKGVNNVFFHNYNYISQHIVEILRLNSNQAVFNWVFWSAEFYNLPEISSSYYIGKSFYYHPTYNLIKRLKYYFFHFREKALGRPYYSHGRFINSFENIKYFFSFLKSDYENVSNYSNATIQHKLFSYLSFEQFFNESSRSEKFIRKNHQTTIMINHNGDPILNHFDILERLLFIKNKFKLVLPLAYGNTKYINHLKKFCFKNFKSCQIEFWEDFISPRDYSEKLFSINVAIFNISVQKGIGNILPLLWNGTKVYLREESPIFIDFIKLGFCIFSIQNDLTEESLIKPLSSDEISLNRSLLINLLSEQAVNSYYKDCFLND